MVITDMGSDRYCLRWNNHQNNLLGVFSQLLQEESLVDVTLACSEGHSIRAHKVVLSACSSYFQSLFLDHPNRHPIIILKDVCFAELRTLVEFMYRGEVNLEYCQLPTFLKTAESLQVKGLAEMTHLRSSLSPDRDMLPSRERQSSQDELPATVIAARSTVHEPLPLIRRRSRSPTDTELSDRVSSDATSQPPQQLSPKAAPSSPSRSTTAAGFDTLQRSPSSRLPSSVSPHPPDTSSVCEDLSPDADDDVSSIHSGPSDMFNNSQILSPNCQKVIPGPSSFLPVQDAPLSLKKESNNADWEKNEEKSLGGNNSSDYGIRHLQDSGLSSLDSLYRMPPSYNLLLPSTSAAAALTVSLSSSASSLSLDQVCSSSRSSTPFMFPPFPGLPVLPPSFFPDFEILSERTQFRIILEMESKYLKNSIIREL